MGAEIDRRPVTVLARLLLAVLSAIIVATLAAPAHAAIESPLAPPPASASESVTSDDEAVVAAPARAAADSDAAVGICTGGKNGNASLLLPLSRWSTATTEFNSHIGATHLMTLTKKATRDAFFQATIGVSNAMWEAAATLTTQAAVMCPLATAGYAMDESAKKLGETMFDSGIVVAIIVITLIVLLFQSVRNGNGVFKQIMAKLAVAALLMIMLIGSQGSTGSQDGSTPYSPGTGSPGWFITAATNAITALASGPASLMQNAVEEDRMDPLRDVSELHSDHFLHALHSGYKKEFDVENSSEVSSVVPLTLSMMWEQTGLEAWKVAQFGGANKFGDKNYSFLLDNLAGIPVTQAGSSEDLETAGDGPSITEETYIGEDGKEVEYEDGTERSTRPFPNAATQRAVWNRAKNDEGLQLADFEENSAWEDAVLWNAADEEQMTRVLSTLGWCNYTGDGWEAQEREWAGWDDDWDGTRGGILGLGAGKAWPADADALADQCKYLIDNDELGTTHPGNWSDDPSVIKKSIKSDQFNETKDYLLHIHGAGNAGIVTASVFVVASIAVLAVFGLISVGVMLSKIMVVVMMFAVFALLLMVMLPNVETQRLGKFVKTLMGSIIFSSALVLIISTVAMVSNLLVSIAESIAKPGGVLMLVWTGLAPLLAVFAIQWIFKSVLGLPSPFKLTSAMAYGSAAGAMGNAATSGMGQMGSAAGRMGRTAMRMGAGALRNRGLKNALQGAGGSGAGSGSSAESAVGSGNNRPGAMTPFGADGSKTGQKLDAVQQASERRKAAGKGSLFGKVAGAGAAAGGVMGAMGGDVAEMGSKLTGKIADSKFGQWAGRGLSKANDFGGLMLDPKAHRAAAQGKTVDPRSFTELGGSALSKAKGLATGAAGGIAGAAQAVGRTSSRVGQAVYRGSGAQAVVGAGAAVGRTLGNTRTGALAKAGLGKARENIKQRAQLAAANAKAHPIRTAAAVGGTMAATAVAGPLGGMVAGGLAARGLQKDPLGRSRKEVKQAAAVARERNEATRQEAMRRGMSPAALVDFRQKGQQKSQERQRNIQEIMQFGLDQDEARRYVDSGAKEEPATWAERFRKARAGQMPENGK